MNSEQEVQVLWRPRRRELQSYDDKGATARKRLVEVYGQARRRAQANHRKAMAPWVSCLSPATPDFRRWSLCSCSGQDFVGLEVRQNDGLEFVFPRGYSNLMFGSHYPLVYDSYGLRDDTVWASAGNRIPLTGDFDVQVDFSDYQGVVGTDTGAGVRIGLLVEDTFYEEGPENHAFISMGHVASGQRYRAQVVTEATSQVDATQSSSDTSGKLRITRSGSTVSLYYWTGTSWSTALATYSSFVSGTVYVALHYTNYNGIGTIRLRNFTLSSPATSYPTVGTYVSATYDAARPDPNNANDLRTMSWDWLSWQASTPVGTSVRFQVATSDVPSPASWDFVGPDGTSGTSFNSPADLPSSLSESGNKRYLRYQATFTGDGTVTPVLYRVDVGFSGSTPPTLITYEYDVAAFCFDYAKYDEATLDGVTSSFDGARYDESLLGQGAAGNLTRKVTETPDGITTEVRDAVTWSDSDRVNNLNQIQRVDITPPGGSTTSWSYSYDASGNLTSKSNGTDTWLYAWDEDNRLTQVTLPSEATVSYTYDMLGRMLTRATSSPAVTTRFEWDGWDCVRKYTTPGASGSSGVTLYYVVNGELMAFDRDHVTYQVHADALGSVRMVTGPDGTVLARFDYDAWGNELDSSHDNVPGGGLAYGFVGALGVRWDAGTGLHYMRNRWYDPGMGRFVSRDAIGILKGFNLYAYVSNRPVQLVDPYGLEERLWTLTLGVRLGVKGIVKPVSQNEQPDMGHAAIYLSRQGTGKISFALSNVVGYAVNLDLGEEDYARALGAKYVSISAEINDKQLDSVIKVLSKYRKLGKKAYNQLVCTEFAEEVWNAAGVQPALASATHPNDLAKQITYWKEHGTYHPSADPLLDNGGWDVGMRIVSPFIMWLYRKLAL